MVISSLFSQARSEQGSAGMEHKGYHVFLSINQSLATFEKEAVDSCGVCLLMISAMTKPNPHSPDEADKLSYSSFI